MEPTKLTKEQEAEVKKLLKTAKWRVFKMCVKNLSLMFVMSALVIFLDVKYVNSQVFLGIASFFNGLTLFFISGKDLENENNWIKNEATRILKLK
jgi:hypothetical protein